MGAMGLVHQKYKVAVVQAAPVFLDLRELQSSTAASAGNALERLGSGTRWEARL